MNISWWPFMLFFPFVYFFFGGRSLLLCNQIRAAGHMADVIRDQKALLHKFISLGLSKYTVNLIQIMTHSSSLSPRPQSELIKGEQGIGVNNIVVPICLFAE